MGPTRISKPNSRERAGVYADIATWPDFDVSSHCKETRLRVALFRKCAQKYLKGKSAEESVAGTCIGARDLQKKVEKALKEKPDGSGIFGIEAFIRYAAQSKRISKRDYADVDPTGGAYSLTATFQQYPAIEDELVEFLLSRIRPNKVSRRVLHNEFKIICRRQGLGSENYPFSAKQQGKPAIVDWYHSKFLPKYFDQFVAAEFGPDAACANEYSNGDGKSETPPPLFSYWMLDSTPLDIFAKVSLPDLQGVMEEMEVGRGAVLRLICINPTVNLSWRLVLAEQPSGDDLSNLFWDAMNGQVQPDETVPDVHRLPGANWPAFADERFKWALPRRVLLDNALAHLKDAVQNIVTDLWGGEVVLGKPADPKARAQVESAFSRQARRVIHQLPGTTGANPTDYKRKRANVPLRGKVELHDLVHVLDTYIVNENISPAESAMYKSPLKRLLKMLDQGLLTLSHLAEERRKEYWFSDVEVRPIHFDMKAGRAPYLNFKYATYTSERLKRIPNIGSLRVRPGIKNLQFVMAWFPDGSPFGELQARGVWGQFPNDMRIRRMYGQYKKAADFEESPEAGPLHALFSI